MNLTRAVVFALRGLRREWRAGELGILSAALVVAVAGVTAVGFFTDRVQTSMDRQAGELLAADLVVTSPDPIPGALEREAQTRGLKTARTLTFASVVVAGARLRLAEVKAVGPGYPLRGRLRIADGPFQADRPTPDIPGRGEAWPDPRLAQVLELEPGDGLSLGVSGLRTGPVLSYEPDRGGDLFSIAPRLLVNLADIPASGLVQPGSRVKYHLLVAGPISAVDGYRDWLSANTAPGASIQDLGNARPELRMALERARQFLGLAALISVVLAGVAAAVAARHYVNRRMDTVAILRCLGAGSWFVAGVALIQMLVVGLVAGLGGGLLGLLAQTGIAELLTGMLPAPLPAPSPWPLVTGLGTGLVTLLGFVLPPVLALRRVPPSRVLRRESLGTSGRTLGGYLSALAALVVLAAWQAGDARLTAYILAGTLGALGLLAGGALLLIQGLSPLRSRVGVSWRFGLAGIARHARTSTLQVMAFGAGIMVLLLLFLVRNDLLDDWYAALPEDAPNLFLINIQPDQVSDMRRFLKGLDLRETRIYPMVRGRLVGINDRPVVARNFADGRARRLVTREFNLSWAEHPQKGNRIVQGHWWDSRDKGSAQFSVEQGLAETLGIQLGDRLTYRVAGQEFSGTVTSLRGVEWDSFQVNFFVVMPPGVLDDFPATYITSFHLPQARRQALTQLVRDFPSVTILDVTALMSRVRGIMDQATLAVEYVFLFTLLAGLVVLAAAILSTLDERRFESVILRTLGGTRRQVLQGLLAEFAALGALAGLLAALAATLIGWALADRVFHLNYQPDPLLWVTGLAMGALVVGTAGLMGTRSLLNIPPIQGLRDR